ncbi:MAG TPA: TonB C-terminal domain-containing protein [Bdellovibrionota bacterium]|nr:TonB C-terminal domain-containing protein [Bdellovibrionota bacterium]
MAMQKANAGSPFAILPGGANGRPWAIAVLIALLWHVAWLMPRVPWTRIAPPARVDVQPIDPSKLEAIRRTWDRRQKQLLLDKDPSRASEAEPPPDARYFSNKNRRVEREQRARDSAVLPKPGSPQPPSTSEAGKARRKQGRKSLPALGALGVPMPPPLPEKSEDGESAGEAARPRSAPGGEQFVKDPEVPEGSENLLNSQESVYYSFYSRLYEAIAPIWQSRLREIPPKSVLQGDYTTVVDVIFDRSGSIVAIQRNQPSGVEEFDQAVDDAWRRVGRFPNPPQGLLDSQGQVHTGWSFTVRIQGGMPFEILPPERNY